MGKEEVQPTTIDDFYNDIQHRMNMHNTVVKTCYLTSRSTEKSIEDIKYVCDFIEKNCEMNLIPTKGVFLKKTKLSVSAYKYFICNTAFECQSLLSDDTGCGHLVDFHPPFSKYLLVEILWRLNFEFILAESILHFPLDLCIEILEVLPRCIDLLESQKATKFLSTIIPNAYKKLIILRDTGSQTKDIEENTKLLAGNIQELISQFTNERFLKFSDISKADQYKRHGILLKTIIQMVRTCLTCKSKKVELECELEKLYKLTFGWEPVHKIEDSTLQRYLTEIDRELMNLLLKKVKEIDCNIYLNWIEYNDEENTSLTLQRAIGLECYFFIENTKEIKDTGNKEYEHLIQCLSQLASKPDPENSVESMQLPDLCQGVQERRKDCLKTLFQRYKEWDDSVIDSIDSHINLLDKEDCMELFEHLAKELNNSTDTSTSENLQTYILCLAKALVFLDITDLYEIVIALILRFQEDDNLENRIDITNFERFIALNPNFSTAKNLRVVLFFLCLKTKFTLKILLKMAIGHSDYPDVAVSLDDLLLLMPIMKIQTESKYATLVDGLRTKCSEKGKGTICVNMPDIKKLFDERQKRPKTVSLVIRVLQEICLDGGDWNSKRFTDLIILFRNYFKFSEIINEVFIPFLWSDSCTMVHLRTTLTILHKFQYDLTQDIDNNLLFVIASHAVNLLDNKRISRYITDELVSQIQEILDRKWVNYEDMNEKIHQSSTFSIFFHRDHFLPIPINIYKSSHNIKTFERLSSRMMEVVNFNKIIRNLYLKCTKKQYLEYASNLFKTPGKYIIPGPNKLLMMDRIIQLTFETCLLCLEFPEVAAPDTISFLCRCLHYLLVNVLKGSSKNLRKSLKLSMDTHHKILKTSIDKTVLAEMYNKLFKDVDAIENRLTALELFAQECIVKSDEIREFKDPKSPLAIKLWISYDLLEKALDEGVVAEEYIRSVEEYFKSQSSS